MKIWIGCTAPEIEAVKTLRKEGLIKKQTYLSLRGMLGTEQEFAVNLFLQNNCISIIRDREPCVWCGKYHLTYNFRDGSL